MQFPFKKVATLVIRRRFALTQRFFSYSPTHPLYKHACNETGACGCKCHTCGGQLGKCTLFCPSCTAIQKLNSTSCNFFELFGFSNSYDLDQASVDGAFKKLQWMLHPDKFSLKSSEEQNTSTHNSSVVNVGYAALKCPLARAQTLVSDYHNVLYSVYCIVY